ncbi:MAG: pyruvate kinase [Mogibacterium sp.]|nr:pyruvate kinase [Mogibacterium sp.]
MRRTKVVCTMGPRENDDLVLNELVKEMDVARFNFSHGTHESHLAMLQRVRKAADAAGRPIACLLDTKGPEIRTGLLDAPVEIVKGNTVTVYYGKEKTTADRIAVNYRGIAKDVEAGAMILIDDGLIALEVEEVKGKEVLCKVLSGGRLGARKGVNIPDSANGLPGVTKQDIADIEFGIENGFDYIAASFVRNAATVRKIRKMIRDRGASTKIIAKIESQEGIDNLDEIIAVSDGIMVARGDLGVEVDAKKIPELQREMISKCNAQGKLVITATQMLDSMIRNPRPTRAEVTDVANAVYEGSDAIMLSGETASGEYPVEALKMMVSIAEYTEQFAYGERDFSTSTAGAEFAAWIQSAAHIQQALKAHKATRAERIAETTCRAAVAAADELDAAALIAPTITGTTALLLSKYRPEPVIYALSPDPQVVRQMMLYWGVQPLLAEWSASTDEMIAKSIAELRRKRLLHRGDVCVLTAGAVSEGDAAKTNMLRVIEV